MPALRPFDWDIAFERLRAHLRGVPPAAMFALRDEGFNSLFEQLVASLLSARTRDEDVLPACRRLFAVARSPAALAALDEARLLPLLAGVTFPEPKARDLLALARRIRDEHGGATPDTPEGLMAFRGVGPKVAALALGVALGRPFIAVDIHVHRITNRWGILATPTPEKTQAALEQLLSAAYRVEINERLVPFGKTTCTGFRPRCPECPLLDMCAQVGVATASPRSA
ncbi:endonuclease III domain-containing protein [Roseococcus sp. DSY-14]|uniref:endonuclease III domain-containing protein n=1 Tax=Roseococcus sp. DSY-14 TaxID=3369650 RepID=UPI00387AED76